MSTDDPFVLLTGASSGIGRHMAVRLSATRRLILHGRDADRLAATLQQCHAPERHRVWRFDLEDSDHAGEALGQLLAAERARVAAFIHCAAVLQLLPLRSLTPESVRRALAVNLLSAMEIVRALTMRTVNERHLRSVVFISSIASQFGARGLAAYCASKGGLDALMKALAVELAPRVRVNSVLPGGVRSEMTTQIFGDPVVAERLAKDYPLGTGEPEDVLHAVEFLLSDNARWITGQQLVVDGGRTANISA